MIFRRKSADLMTAISDAGDTVEIRKDGELWRLTVLEVETGLPMLTYSSTRQHLCCQEACRFFGVGPFTEAALYVNAAPRHR